MSSSLPGDSRALSDPLRSTPVAPSGDHPSSFSSPWTLRVLLAIFILLQIGVGLIGPKTDLQHYRRAAERLLETGTPYGERYTPFLYPPPLAAIFLVGVPFPARAVATGWVIVSAVLLAIAVARVAGGRARIVLFALVFAPFAVTQWDAQGNALILLAIAVARPLLANRELAAGLGLGASLAVKPLALPAVAALAVRGRVRAAVLAIAVGLASFLIVLPFGGSPLAAAQRFGRILTRPVVQPSGDSGGIEIALVGTLDRLCGPDGAELRRTAVKGIPLLVLAAAMLRKLSPVATFDAVLAGTLLGARFSWLHHSAILFPAVVSLGPGTASVVAALFAISMGKRFLGEGVTACGTIALLLISIAPIVIGPRRETSDKRSSGW